MGRSAATSSGARGGSKGCREHAPGTPRASIPVPEHVEWVVELGVTGRTAVARKTAGSSANNRRDDSGLQVYLANTVIVAIADVEVTLAIERHFARIIETRTRCEPAIPRTSTRTERPDDRRQ